VEGNGLLRTRLREYRNARAGSAEQQDEPRRDQRRDPDAIEIEPAAAKHGHAEPIVDQEATAGVAAVPAG
jgi:hypothetical protein